MNDSGTGERIGTPATQRRSLSDLRTLRNRVGAETTKGRLLSNLSEQMPWLADPDPRPWVTHPMQTVHGLMQWQVGCLTEHKAA